VSANRIAALRAALIFHIKAGTFERAFCGETCEATAARAKAAVRATAEEFLVWLGGTRHIHLLAGVVVDQSTGLPTGTPSTTGGITVQIHDNEQFELTLAETDSKGQATTDPGVQVSWTSSDESVVPLSVSDDSLTFHVVAGLPGSAVIEVSVTLPDGSILTATEAVDVVAGGVATIALNAGTVSPQ
jgi:hypothetical protein